jgi:hypothetical protein
MAQFLLELPLLSLISNIARLARLDHHTCVQRKAAGMHSLAGQRLFALRLIMLWFTG